MAGGTLPGVTDTGSAPPDDGPGVTPDDLLGAVAPYFGGPHRATAGVLITLFRTGRQVEAWLSGILSAEGLDTSEYAALSALWFEPAPHRLAAGEIAERLVQTTGGTTKTIRRLEERSLVRRVGDPEDRRRALIELTPAGLELARTTLDLVLDAFDLDIGALDTAERTELGRHLARLSVELHERLERH